MFCSLPALVMHSLLIRHCLKGQFIIFSKPSGLEKDQDDPLAYNVTSPLKVGVSEYPGVALTDSDLEVQTMLVTLPYLISFPFHPSFHFCSIHRLTLSLGENCFKSPVLFYR